MFILQGNPIEVISSSNNDNHGSFGVSSFLQNLITTNSTAPAPVPPVQAKIPGLESPTDNAREVFNFIESKVKVDESGPVMWGDKPLNKYQSWPSPDITWNHAQETPVSPPAFEQESFSNPVEYVDTNMETSRFSMSFNNVPALGDVDHRMLESKSDDCLNEFDQIATIPLPKHDVDDRVPIQSTVPNRNLISLTESPSVNDSWKISDSDYRVTSASVPSPVTVASVESVRNVKTPQDNIESVDMEMSDEESDSKHEERGGGSRHRKSTFKDDESVYKKTNQPQLQLPPPPTPWDVVNVSAENANDAGDSASKNGPSKVAFDKMMSFLSKPPPVVDAPPIPDFCFPMPPRGMPHNNMLFPRPPNLSIPPPGDPKIFPPRPDLPPPPPMPPVNLPNRMPGGGFNRPPFGFIPFPPAGPNSNPMFPNNANQSSRNEFVPSAGFQPSEPPPGFQPSERPPNYGSEAPKNNEFSRNDVNNIEPIIKTRQFDNRLPESETEFENTAEYPPKPIRSNLKEISLSDVLEQTMLRASQEDACRNPNLQRNSVEGNRASNTSLNAIAEDLFGDESAQNDGDDGDDLYNNIEDAGSEQEGNFVKDDSGLADGNNEYGAGPRKFSNDFKSKQNNHFMPFGSEGGQNVTPEGEQKPRNFKSPRKAPFQGFVPKASKLPLAPPNFIEDDQRNPWPLMPIIDLSNEGTTEDAPDEENEDNGDDDQVAAFMMQNETTGEGRGAFHRRGAKNDFRPRSFNNFGGDRRFPSPGQSPMRFRGDSTNRGRGRFMSPRGPDFRPRMGGNFTPNQDQMRRMPRPPFNSPNMRGNFQNSPRTFKGRPGRPFRRGW